MTSMRSPALRHERGIMSRVAKVEGSIKVLTESGGSMVLHITGHGMSGSKSIYDLGPYVGRLVREELQRILADEPEPEPAPKPLPPTKPITSQIATAPKRAKGAPRG